MTSASLTPPPTLRPRRCPPLPQFVKSKIAKPYNSILGEFFRCYYDVPPVTLSPEGVPQPTYSLDLEPSAEVLANAGKQPSSSKPTKSAASSAPSSAPGTAAPSVKEQPPTRVVFLNEQTSHHPPVSCYHIESRGPKGVVQLKGCDHLSAKFTGTTVRVFPGSHNKGLFVDLPERGESYHITHPMAAVAGLLLGKPYATILESTTVTCTGGKERYRAIVAYAEESWIRKPQYAVSGVVYKVQDDKELEWTKVKQVPTNRVVASFEGCWRGEVRFKLAQDSVSSAMPCLAGPTAASTNSSRSFAHSPPSR